MKDIIQVCRVKVTPPKKQEDRMAKEVHHLGTQIMKYKTFILGSIEGEIKNKIMSHESVSIFWQTDRFSIVEG